MLDCRGRFRRLSNGTAAEVSILRCPGSVCCPLLLRDRGRVSGRPCPPRTLRLGLPALPVRLTDLAGEPARSPARAKAIAGRPTPRHLRRSVHGLLVHLSAGESCNDETIGGLTVRCSSKFGGAADWGSGSRASRSSPIASSPRRWPGAGSPRREVAWLTDGAVTQLRPTPDWPRPPAADLAPVCSSTSVYDERSVMRPWR
jgi:hypothetical protein